MYAGGVTPEQEQRRTEARRLHGEGHTIAEIARRVGVSKKTASSYCRGLGLPNNPLSRLGRNESRFNPSNNEARRAERIEQAFRLRLQGLAIHEVAREMGVPQPTIRAWIDQSIEIRVGPQVEKLRELANARLDYLRMRVWDIIRTASGELRLKAIDRALQIERRWAANNGSDSPVRVDAVITERSQADLEMEELLREAQARNAVIEGQIVDDAVTDPAE